MTSNWLLYQLGEPEVDTMTGDNSGKLFSPPSPITNLPPSPSSDTWGKTCHLDFLTPAVWACGSTVEWGTRAEFLRPFGAFQAVHHKHRAGDDKG